MAAAVELVTVLFEAVLPGSHFIPESCEQGVMRAPRDELSVKMQPVPPRLSAVSQALTPGSLHVNRVAVPVPLRPG
ncbi:unnamed protein product [Boreogadus saida]